MTKAPLSKSVARMRQAFPAASVMTENHSRPVNCFLTSSIPLCPRILAICLFKYIFVPKIVVNIHIIYNLSIYLHLPISI